MTSFIFALHAGASCQQEAIVRDGLAEQFPEFEFKPMKPSDNLSNTIIPLVGKLDPNDPDKIIVRPPGDLVDDVREVFTGLVGQAKSARVS